MLAVFLVILRLDAQRLARLVEPDAHRVQVVLPSAGDEQPGQGGGVLRGALQPDRRVVLAACHLVQVAEEQREFRRARVIGLGAHDLQGKRPRKAGCRGVQLRVQQRGLERAVPAHRDARDEGVLAFGCQAEHILQVARQFLDEVGEIVLPVGLVDVEAAAHRGHDHHQPVGAGIGLDGGIALPGAGVVAQTVQQVEHLALAHRHVAHLARVGQDDVQAAG